MSEQTDPHNTIEIKTRSNVTYILVVSAMLMLAYIIYRWGQEKEILTLIIGLIGGTILGMPLGVYYSGNTKRDSQVTVPGDNPSVNIGGYQPLSDVETHPPGQEN